MCTYSVSGHIVYTSTGECAELLRCSVARGSNIQTTLNDTHACRNDSYYLDGICLE